MIQSRLFQAGLLFTAVVSSTLPVLAQDSGALIDALIRKGILTNQEGEDIRAELVKESNTIPAHAIGGGKSTDRLSIGMRMQSQYVALKSTVDGAAIQAPSNEHFFLRRMYLTAKAGVGGDWGAQFTYDFAGGSYDDAIIQYKPSSDLSFDFGLRKVNVANEERYSSGNLKAIERSGVTRYFVESNNNRRLGAASYRIGAFMDGKHAFNNDVGLVYSAAITNPERNESFSGASGTGDNTNNNVALWGNVGITGKLPGNGSWILGFGTGHEPDQGGFSTATLGKGYDLDLYSTYFELTYGKFGVLAEYLSANVQKGISLTRDAKPAGWFIMPSLYLTDSLELVVRYQQLDSDGRGVQLADVVRSAPTAGTMNKFDEWYYGANYYLRALDLRFQLGAVFGKTKETVTGAPASAKTQGVRSQMQLQF
jgi:polyhydroxyalkanoate synthesis regulator phasin